MTNFIKYLNIFSIFTLVSASAFARGGDVSGGGYGYGDQLLDFAESREGTAKLAFQPEHLPCFGFVERALDRLEEAGQKGLRKEIEKVFQEKSWFFVSGGIPPLRERGIHFLLDDSKKRQIAVQKGAQIVVDREWFQRAEMLEQAGLLMHEALIGVAMQYGVNHDSVRELVRTLFSVELGGHFPDAVRLRHQLKNLGFDRALREIELRFVNKMVELVEAMICAVESRDHTLGEKVYRDFLFLKMDVPSWVMMKAWENAGGELSVAVFRIRGTAAAEALEAAIYNLRQVLKFWRSLQNALGSA